LFNRAKELYGEKIPMPRLAGRQTCRNNVPADSALEYYYRAVFLPFIDNCLFQMRERFKQHHNQSLQLVSLMPALCDKRSFNDIKDGVTFYASLLPCGTDAVEAEFLRWQHYWTRNEKPDAEKPSSVVEALRVANQLCTYPAISTLLRIFATLPVTTATCERSFSALKYLKTYLRSTISEDRLNGLSLLFVNRDLPLQYDRVIEEFSKFSRRLDF
jgi:hypothetical protein